MICLFKTWQFDLPEEGSSIQLKHKYLSYYIEGPLMLKVKSSESADWQLLYTSSVFTQAPQSGVILKQQHSNSHTTLYFSESAETVSLTFDYVQLVRLLLTQNLWPLFHSALHFAIVYAYIYPEKYTKRYASEIVKPMWEVILIPLASLLDKPETIGGMVLAII